jgi:hypothetical protein
LSNVSCFENCHNAEFLLSRGKQTTQTDNGTSSDVAPINPQLPRAISCRPTLSSQNPMPSNNKDALPFGVRPPGRSGRGVLVIFIHYSVQFCFIHSEYNS